MALTVEVARGWCVRESVTVETHKWHSPWSWLAVGVSANRVTAETLTCLAEVIVLNCEVKTLHEIMFLYNFVGFWCSYYVILWRGPS